MLTLVLSAITTGLVVLCVLLGMQLHRCLIALSDLDEIIQAQSIIIESYIEERKRNGE